MNNKQDQQEKVECSPISEQNEYQDTTQKRDFPEIHQMAREKEVLIKWLLEQLQLIQHQCTLIVSMKNNEQNNEIKQLKRIIDDSLERARNQNYSFETIVSPFDSPPKSNLNQVINDSENQIKSQLASYLTQQQPVDNSQIKYNSEYNQQRQQQNFRATQENSQQQEQTQFELNQSHQYRENLKSLSQKSKSIFMSLILNKDKLKEDYKYLRIEQQNLKNAQQLYIQQEIRNHLIRFQNQILLPSSNAPNQQKQLSQLIDMRVLKDQIKNQYKQKVYQNFKAGISKYLVSILKEINENFKNIQTKLVSQYTNLKAEFKQQQITFQKQLKIIISKQNQSNLNKIQDLSENLSKMQKENQDLKLDINRVKVELEKERENIIELQKIISEEENRNSLSNINDHNIYNILQSFEQKQIQVCQNGNQAFQKLQMVDNISLQISQIKKVINKDYENEIDKLKNQIINLEMTITTLENDNKQLKEDLKQIKCQNALNNTLQKVSEQEKQNYNLSVEINKKANQITQLKDEIKNLNEFVQGKEDQIKKEIIQEYESKLILQLEGCYNLQQLSILFGFLGLKIFRQYIISENFNEDQVNSTMKKLNQFNLICQRKENQKLKERKEIDKLYINYHKQLKDIYEETLELFKKLLKDIEDRRIQAQ